MVYQRKLAQYIVGFLFVVGIAGCSANPQPYTPTGSRSTDTPTPSPQETATITASATSLVPTLPEQEAYSALRGLLNDNDGCRFPCWWNINPGTSLESDVRTEWGTLLGISDNSDLSLGEKGFIGFEFIKDNTTVSIDAFYSAYSTSNYIRLIAIATQATRPIVDGFEDVFNSPDYKDILSSVLLSGILTDYGPPDQIALDMEVRQAEPWAPLPFHIWLLYPDNGAIVRYIAFAEEVDGTMHFCPADTFVDI